MNRSSLYAIAVITAALSGAQTVAAAPVASGLIVGAGEAGVNFEALDARAARSGTAASRDDVQAQLREALRTGELVAAGEAGLPLNQLTPQRYPQPTATAAKTREQVRAEFRDALRTGEVTVGGEFGRKLNELHPQRFGKLS